jgi:putative hydrolase of the HAD superfamily
MSKTAITAVAFDYGNVLSRPQDSTLAARLQVLSGLTPEAFDRQYWRFRQAYDRGNLNAASYWGAVISDTGISDQPERLTALVETDVASWLHLDEAMMTWVGDLTRGGIPSAILSNMPRDVLDGMRRQRASVLQQFEVTVMSCEVGSIKPEAPIYEKLLDDLGAAASDVLFVDDREENVAAAVRLGMHGVHFTSRDHLWQRVEAEYDLPLPTLR